MSNNLRQAKKDLKAFAKRAKDVKYTESLLFSYLITGMITFSIGLNTSSNVLYERLNKELVMSADKTRTTIKKKKKANEETIEELNLELIQLMEQGDQVVKSPWQSWQFGANTFMSNNSGTYKGRGDKNSKYSFDGIYTRGNWGKTDILSSRRRGLPPLNYSTIGKHTYGLATLLHVQEPEVEIQIMANVRPKAVQKEEITITPRIDMPREVVKPAINLNVNKPLDAPKIELPSLNPVDIQVTPPTAPDTPPIVTAPEIEMNLTAPKVEVSINPPELTMSITPPTPNASNLTITPPGVSEVSEISVTKPSSINITTPQFNEVKAVDFAIGTAQLSTAPGLNFQSSNSASPSKYNLAPHTTINVNGNRNYVSTWGYVSNLNNVNLNVNVNISNNRAFDIDEGVAKLPPFTFYGTINLNKSKNVGIDVQGTHTQYSGGLVNQENDFKSITGVANIQIINKGTIIGNAKDGATTIENQVGFGFNNFDASANNSRNELQNYGTITLNSINSAGMQLRPENAQDSSNNNQKRGLNMMAGINEYGGKIELNGYGSYGLTTVQNKRQTGNFTYTEYKANGDSGTVVTNGGKFASTKNPTYMSKMENKGTIDINSDSSIGIGMLHSIQGVYNSGVINIGKYDPSSKVNSNSGSGSTTKVDGAVGVYANVQTTPVDNGEYDDFGDKTGVNSAGLVGTYGIDLKGNVNIGEYATKSAGARIQEKGSVTVGGTITIESGAEQNYGAVVEGEDYTRIKRTGGTSGGTPESKIGRIDIASTGKIDVKGKDSLGYVLLKGAGSNAGNITVNANNSLGFYGNKGKFENSGEITTTGEGSHAVVLQNTGSGTVTSATQTLTFDNTGNITANTEGTVGIYAESGSHFSHSGTGKKITAGKGAVGIYAVGTGTKGTVKAEIDVLGSKETATKKYTGIGVYSDGNSETTFNTGAKLTLGEKTVGLFSSDASKFENTFINLQNLEASIGDGSVFAYFNKDEGTPTVTITNQTLGNLNVKKLGDKAAMFYGDKGTTVNINGSIDFTSFTGSTISPTAQFLVSNNGNANIGASKTIKSNLKTTVSGLNEAKVKNAGTIEMSGTNESVGIYLKGSEGTNEATGTITADEEKSIGIYGVKNGTKTSKLENAGTIETKKKASVGMLGEEESTINNVSGGIINTDEKESAGIYGSKGSTITNAGTISAKKTGSAGIYASDSKVTNASSGIINTQEGKSAGVYAIFNKKVYDIDNSGTINVGSTTSPTTETKGVGIYAKLENNATATGNVTIDNKNTVAINIKDSIGIYAQNDTGDDNRIIVNNKKDIISSSSSDGAIGIMAKRAKVTNLATSGKIELGGKSSVGIYGTNNSELENFGRILLTNTADDSASVGMLSDGKTLTNNGKITMSGGASAGMLGKSLATLTNASGATITIKGKASAGMYAENATPTNDGIINVKGEKSAGIFAKVSDGKDRSIVNTGSIKLTGTSETKSAGMYVEIANGATGTTTLENKNLISVNQKESVGMYIKNKSGNRDLGIALNSAPNGKINLEKESTVGIYVDNALGENKSIINVRKGNSAGMYGSSDSKITNALEINISNEKSAGMYALDSEAINTKDGKIKIKGNSGATGGSAGMYGKLTSNAKKDYTILNEGKIILNSELKNVGIYGETDKNVNHTLTLKNKKLIKINNGSKQSVGIFAVNDNTNDKDKLLVVNTEDGKIIADSKESIGISAEKSKVENSGIITMKNEDSAGIYGKSGSEVTNKNKITIEEKSSAGIYLEDSSALNETTGKITVKKGASAGIYGKYSKTNTTNYTIENKGIITLKETSGENKSAGIYGELEAGGTGKLTITNNNQIKVNMKESVGIYGKNSTTDKSNLTAENNKNIEVNSENSVGMLADFAIAKNNAKIRLDKKESTGMYGINGSEITNTSDGVITIKAITGGTDSKSIGMYVTGKDSAGNATKGINDGIIKVKGKKGTGMLASAEAEIVNNKLIDGEAEAVIGMYGVDSGSKVTNEKDIKLSGKKSTGIFAKDSAVAKNKGTIELLKNSNKSVGMFGLTSKAGETINLTNEGSIKIDSKKSTGIFTSNMNDVADSVVKNTGTIELNNESTVGIYTPKSNVQSVGKINLANKATSSVAVYLSNKAKANTSTGEIDLNGASQNQVAYYVKGTSSEPTGELYGGNIGKIKGYGVGVYLDGGTLDANSSELDYTANAASGFNGNGIIGLLMKNDADISAYNKNIKVGDSAELPDKSKFYAIGIYADAQGSSTTSKTIATSITTGKDGVGLFAENGSNIIYTGTMNIGDGSTAGTGIYIGNGGTGATKPSTVEIGDGTTTGGANISLNGKNGVGAIVTTKSNAVFNKYSTITFTGAGVGIYGQKGAIITDKGGTLITNGNSVERTRITEGSSRIENDLTGINAVDTGNIVSHVINGEAIVDSGITIEAKSNSKNIIGLMADGNKEPYPSHVTWAGARDYEAINNGIIDLSNATTSTAMYLDSSRGINNEEIIVGDKSTGIYGIYNKGTLTYSAASPGTKNVGKIKTIAGSKITIGKESAAIYSVGFDKVENDGKIEGDKQSVGIYATNSASNDYKAINVENNGEITLGDGSAGIYVAPDSLTKDTTISTVTNTGNITVGDSILNSVTGKAESTSVGIFVKHKTILNTTGDITIGNKGFALYGNDSTLNVNGGDYDFSNNGSLAYLENGATLNYNKTGTLTTSSEPMLFIVDSEAKMNKNDIIVSTKGTGIYMTGTSKFSGWNNITLNNGSTGIYADDSDATVTGKKIIGTSDKAKGIVARNSSVTNNANMEFNSDDSIGIFSQNKSTAAKKIVNNGNIDITGKRSIAAYLEGTMDQTFENTGIINVDKTTTSVKDDSTVGIYAQNGSRINVKNSGTINVGEASFGIYSLSENGNVETTGSSVINVEDKAIGIYKKGGTANVGGKINVADHVAIDLNSEPVGIYGSSGVTISDTTSNFNVGDKSYGVILANPGLNRTNVYSNSASSNVALGKESTFIYTEGKAKVTNRAAITSGTNNGIIAIYGKDGADIVNEGIIDLKQGIGNQGILVTGASSAINKGKIKIGKTDKSDPDNIIYGIGMAAIDGASAINSGDIYISENLGIGMYGDKSGTTLENTGNIYLDASSATPSEKIQTMMGVFANNGTKFVNRGTIKTVGSYSGNENVQGLVGVAILNGSTLENYGTIDLDADSSYSVLIKGTERNKSIIKNYGNINIKGLRSYGVRYDGYSKGVNGNDLPIGDDATPANVLPAINSGTGKITSANGAQDYYAPKDPSKTIGGAGIVQLPNGKLAIQRNGVLLNDNQVQLIDYTTPNVNYALSNFGVYVDTLGKTKPINLDGATDININSDLLIGTEFSVLTNEKNIIIGKQILQPFLNQINAGIFNFTPYSASLTWMATPEVNPKTQQITRVLMTKIPYTAFVKRTANEFNFADGLEQRYGVNALDSREKLIFNKLNSIGNNEEALLAQSYDEMMGHQYANVQQRIFETGNLLNKEFGYLRNEWDTKSKDSNKIKIFGMKGNYKTDTAGIIDYKNKAYGFVYLNENETVKLGESSGWYLGAVKNKFDFSDIGGSKEEQKIVKAGAYKSMPLGKDHDNKLNWTVAAEGFFGTGDVSRKFLVVDDIFEAKSQFRSYGLGLRNEIRKNIRTSERTTISPYGSLKMEYGRFSGIKEDTGQVRLEIKSNDYYSIKPEVGVEFKYKKPIAVRTTFTAKLGLAYENELGKVGDVNNKARVRHTTADWFSIRGEKDDRRGNGKVDLNLGIENTRLGITVNAGYDTKGENIRGGLGFRVIY